MSQFYSTGGRRSAMECRETISEYLETQKLVENLVSTTAPPAEAPKLEMTRPEASSTMGAREAAPCQRKDSREFKPTVESPAPSRVDNTVPLKWESALTQAIRTTAPDADTFAQIPSKYSGSALASALAVAPSVPFTPAGTHYEEVPLPEETVPYFPPERSSWSEREDEKPKSRLGSTPEAPCESSTPPVRRKQKKDPTDVYFEDLPKPQETLSMRTALTTAPDRPYSPLVVEGAPKSDTETRIDRSQLQRPTKPDVLPTSFQMNKKEPKPPSYYSPVVLQERIEETSSEEHIQESGTSKTTTIQRETIQNPSVQVVEQERVVQNFPPLFQGFSCSFQNKTEHSQFSVEVTTTPPVMSPPPPQQQVVKQMESIPGYVQKETITEEQREHRQSTKKQEKLREEVRTEQRAKQAEEVVVKRPVQPVHLHKPEYLPQYQVDLSAEAEAELVRMEKMRKAQTRLEEQKMQQQQHRAQDVTPKQPIIKIESEPEPVKHVVEDRPPSRTFSPRPGSTTPSLIHKPPQVIPYYQANLVPQHMTAPPVHVFDPKTPEISRSPSPCPGGRERSLSPVAQPKSNVRAVSPAPGPPPNPLEKPAQMYQSTVQTCSYANPVEQQRTEASMVQKFASQQRGSLQMLEQSLEAKKLDVSEARKAQKYVSQSGNTMTSTSIEEQSRQAHLEQLKKSQIESVERSRDGSTQIQRRKIVTEEFERTQKETNVQIETKRLPFHEVNAPVIEKDAGKGHMTDPRPLPLPLAKPSGCFQQPTSNASASRVAAAATKTVFAPTSVGPVKHVEPPKKPDQPSVTLIPDTGAGSGRQTGGVSVAPRRGRGVLNTASLAGTRVPLCGSCNMQIRGPFITALGKIWCPNHFVCATPSCKRPLQDMGFVEERGQLYCENCFEQYLAPPCSKCSRKIKGDCLKAIGKNFHPECFNCTYCSKLFGNSPFFLEDGSPYCEADWNELFTTKCFACGFPVEAGDRWVEALNNNYHSQCFNCTMCKKNLEGQSFFAKGGRPFCKNHAR